MSLELKTIAVRNRWAYEDLVADAKCIEWVMIENLGNEEVFLWLHQHYGTLRRTIQELHSLTKDVFPDYDDREALVREKYRLIHEQQWCLGELVFEIKKCEAMTLFGSLDKMYQYLVTVHGRPEDVLSLLRWIIRAQPTRRKSLGWVN